MKHKLIDLAVALFALGATMLAFAIFSGAFAQTANPGPTNVAFKLVLSPSELAGKSFETVKAGNETLHIWNLNYLSDRDVGKTELIRTVGPDNQLMVSFVFNEEGKKKLYRFTKKYAKKRVAIFADSKLIGAPVVWLPNFMGERIVLRWPWSEKELRRFVSKMNTKPQTVIQLYIEEQGKYNDIAADSWGNMYTRMNNYFEARRRQTNADRSVVDAERE